MGAGPVAPPLERDSYSAVGAAEFASHDDRKVEAVVDCDRRHQTGCFSAVIHIDDRKHEPGAVCEETHWVAEDGRETRSDTCRYRAVELMSDMAHI